MAYSVWRREMDCVATPLLAMQNEVRAGNEDIAVAAQFTMSCGTCQTVDVSAPARHGPHLVGLIGAKAGANPNFGNYPEALKQAGDGGLVWSEATLDAWLTNPAKLVPGTNTPRRRRHEGKRKLVTAFLNFYVGTIGHSIWPKPYT